MLKVRPGIRIYVSTTAIDMRKSIDSLSVLVQQDFNDDPLSGHLFIFFNRTRDKVKILYWDRNGYVLHYKRMEKHRFVVPNLVGLSQLIITETQLNGLLAGLNFEIMGDFNEIDYDKLF
ncbi:MAG: IS66 family insertion sequence element accessory protein TnpB [Gammaproteobacteria bacterium]